MFASRSVVTALSLRAVLLAAFVGAAGLSAAPAEAAEYRKKETTVAQAPSTAPSGSETATGSVTSRSAGAGTDCFITRKRAFVPGTGYIIRKSTFCN